MCLVPAVDLTNMYVYIHISRPSLLAWQSVCSAAVFFLSLSVYFLTVSLEISYLRCTGPIITEFPELVYVCVEIV